VGIATRFAEFIRFIEFVPYRLPRIWEIVRNGADVAPSSSFDLFDLLHGTDTASAVKVYKLDAVSSSYIHSRGYQACCPNKLADILADLPIRREEYEFVDLGCGKGRGLIVAHEIGFKLVTGVEISPTLCEVATRNLAACDIPGQVLCQDASRFAIPQRPCVVFLYNPFRSTIMKRVLKNIEHRIAISKSDLWLVYLSPFSRRIFDVSKTLRFYKNLSKVAIYRIGRGEIS
jgi:predicted RNA methylase